MNPRSAHRAAIVRPGARDAEVGLVLRRDRRHCGAVRFHRHRCRRGRHREDPVHRLSGAVRGGRAAGPVGHRRGQLAPTFHRRSYLMNTKEESGKVTPITLAKPERLVLNHSGLDAAKRSLDQGAVTPSYGPWRDDIVTLLNGALATELVCVMRYKRHHYTAKGLASPKIAEEFMVHALEETAHGDRIAERIV